MLQKLWLSWLLWTWRRTVEIHKMLGISWLAGRLLASRERRCCMTAGHWSLQLKTLYTHRNKASNALQLNTEARSSNHFCSGKAVSIPYSERVFVALLIQHAKLIGLLYCFDVLLTVHLSIFIQYLTNLMHKIRFTISFISCLYMFRAHVLIIRRSKLHYTASGIITPIYVMIPDAV